MAMSLKIRFDEILDDGNFYSISDSSWFPDQDFKRVGPVRSEIHLRKKGGSRVILDGYLEVVVTLDCDRCLETYRHEIAEKFQVDLEVISKAERLPPEHDCSQTEMDTVFLVEPVVDLYQVLLEQAYLVVPSKRVCRDECQGLCPQCGRNMNQSACSCRVSDTSSPFAALADLRVPKTRLH